MTLLGKIMTFVVLMISTAVAVAGMMVYASHRNWKDMAQQLKAEYEEEKEIRTQAQVRIARLQKQLEKEKVSRAQAISNLYTERDYLETEYKDTVTERNKLRNDASNLQNKVAQMMAQVSELDQKIATLRTEKVDLIEGNQKLSSDIVKLIDLIHQTEYSKETLRERSEQLASEIADYVRVMSAYGLTKSSLTDHIPPLIDGKVVAVGKKGRGVIEISLGSNDGLREGHKFDVVRGKVYVGRMKLTYVDTNVAGGVMIQTEEAPRVNDQVTTRLVLKDDIYSVTSK